jgi:nucleolar protein 14
MKQMTGKRTGANVNAQKAAAPAKSGGSALKRLRETLKQAKVIGPGAKTTRVSKKASRSKQLTAALAKKQTKSTLHSLMAEQRQSNPFEHKFTRTKHEVLNKPVKGVAGKPGLTRKRGEEARVKSLLPELTSKNRMSHVVDRRFGEGDTSMSVEDRMLARMMKEKVRAARMPAGAFNLEDGLEDTVLTHQGKLVSFSFLCALIGQAT